MKDLNGFPTFSELLPITQEISDEQIVSEVEAIPQERLNTMTAQTAIAGYAMSIRDRLSIVIAEKDGEIEDLKKRIYDLSINSGKQLIDQDNEILRLRRVMQQILDTPFSGDYAGKVTKIDTIIVNTLKGGSNENVR